MIFKWQKSQLNPFAELSTLVFGPAYIVIFFFFFFFFVSFTFMSLSMFQKD